MCSDSIPGLTVVLAALSRADLREGEDRTGLAAPRCTGKEQIHLLFQAVLEETKQQSAQRRTGYDTHRHLAQVIEFGIDDFVMLTLSGTTYL